MPASAHRLQERLAYRFGDPALLRRALTHRSYSADHNERLEFLGDSVLGLAVAHMLYEAPGDLPEGDLSRVRANLVQQATLHRLALDAGLPECLLLGEGELHAGGRGKPSILADALEAVIGAVYLDAGYPAAQALVRRLFARVDIRADVAVSAKDAKTSLQEWLQGRKLQLPQYAVAAIGGAAHRQVFEVRCAVPELGLQSVGEGASRRAAEQEAAAAMLRQLPHS